MSDSDGDGERDHDPCHDSDEVEEERKRKVNEKAEEAEEEYEEFGRDQATYVVEPSVNYEREPEEGPSERPVKCHDSTKLCIMCQANACDWMFLPCNCTYHDRCLFDRVVTFGSYKTFYAECWEWCPCGGSGVARGSGGGATGSGKKPRKG